MTAVIENFFIMYFIQPFPLSFEKIPFERLRCQAILVNYLLRTWEIGEIGAKMEDIRAATVYFKGEVKGENRNEEKTMEYPSCSVRVAHRRGTGFLSVQTE